MKVCAFRTSKKIRTLRHGDGEIVTILTDMIKIEFAKFMFKYNNRLLPPSFNNSFTKLDVIHHYNTRQKATSEFFQPFIASETGKKSLQHIGLITWKNIPEEFKHCSFLLSKNTLNLLPSPNMYEITFSHSILSCLQQIINFIQMSPLKLIL